MLNQLSEETSNSRNQISRSEGQKFTFGGNLCKTKINLNREKAPKGNRGSDVKTR